MTLPMSIWTKSSDVLRAAGAAPDDIAEVISRHVGEIVIDENGDPVPRPEGVDLCAGDIVDDVSGN